jgi:hypothetical protein
MRDLDLTTLRLFVTVCETRNMARAAEQAHIVGSAISKRLAQLEETVGTPCWCAGATAWSPRPRARRCWNTPAPCWPVRTASSRTWPLCVWCAGAGSAAGHCVCHGGVAGRRRGAFLKNPAHRDIRVDMEERISPEVVRGVWQGSASLGICWAATSRPGRAAVAQPYRSDHLAIVVHPVSPAGRARSVRFEQTLDHEHVSLPVTSAVQVMLKRAAAALGKTLVNRVIVSNFEAALARGQGQPGHQRGAAGSGPALWQALCATTFPPTRSRRCTSCRTTTRGWAVLRTPASPQVASSPLRRAPCRRADSASPWRASVTAKGLRASTARRRKSWRVFSW